MQSITVTEWFLVVLEAGKQGYVDLRLPSVNPGSSTQATLCAAMDYGQLLPSYLRQDHKPVTNTKKGTVL